MFYVANAQTPVKGISAQSRAGTRGVAAQSQAGSRPMINRQARTVQGRRPGQTGR